MVGGRGGELRCVCRGCQYQPKLNRTRKGERVGVKDVAMGEVEVYDRGIHTHERHSSATALATATTATNPQQASPNRHQRYPNATTATTATNTLPQPSAALSLLVLNQGLVQA